MIVCGLVGIAVALAAFLVDFRTGQHPERNLPNVPGLPSLPSLPSLPTNITGMPTLPSFPVPTS